MSKSTSLSRCLPFGIIVLGTLTLGASRGALAEPLADARSAALTAAEEAYQHVDFDTVYSEAHRALKVGNANVRVTTRLHVLLAISAAALGKEAESRENFIAALAISPTLRFDQSLSPKLRSPYLEARGFWEAYPERLSLKAAADHSTKRLQLELEDPARLAHTIRLYLRKAGTSAFTVRHLEASATAEVPLSPDLLRGGFEYHGQLLDAQSNVLLTLANATTPMISRAEGTARSESSRGERQKSSKATARAKSNTWLPQALVIGGLGAAGVGALFNYRREKLASEWNGTDCEQPGQTRLAQCEDVNSDRKLAERLSVGLYAGGGLLVTTGLVTWLLSPSSDTKQAANKQSVRTPVCQIYAGNELGASCSGSF